MRSQRTGGWGVKKKREVGGGKQKVRGGGQWECNKTENLRTCG